MKGYAGIRSVIFDRCSHCETLKFMLIFQQNNIYQSFGGDIPKGCFEFYIDRVLTINRVSKWRELKGNIVILDDSGEGDHNHITGIGSVITNDWFYPEKELKQYKEKWNGLIKI